MGKSREIVRILIQKAKREPKRVVFPEGEQKKILRACQVLLDEKIAWPILLGNEQKIRHEIADLHLDLNGVAILDPALSNKLAAYTDELLRLRCRKGVTRSEATGMILEHNLFGSMMVHMGDADALISGLTQHYPDTIRPALQVIPLREGLKKVAGVYVMITRSGGVYFFADATVNIEPTADDLAEIAISTAATARRFDIEPRVAMLSFSNFGSTRHPLSDKVRRAVEILHERAPDLLVDGEMQADTAVVPAILEDEYPFSPLQGGANVLVFPNLESGNVAYKLLARLGGAEAIGPILCGLSRPVHVLQRGAEVNDIVNMTALAVAEAQVR
jgi:malate dehydrogenase (oxaloacetate-decarboxylating)(NADP+)